MNSIDLILITILACTFVLGLGMVLIRQDIEEIKNLIMDKQFEYKGYICKIYHFTSGEEITGYGAALYKDGKRLVVTNHGWNLIQNGSIDSVIEDCKKYINKLLEQ